MARKPCHVSYRRELIEAISEFVPSQWFSQFSSHGNGNWSAQKVLWVSVVMSWQPRAALRERFQYACDVLREVFPRWKLGSSLSGFLAARQRLMNEMWRPMLLWLQAVVLRHAEAWRVRGWMLFAVGGSRIEAPRTTENEQGLGCAGKESTTLRVFQTTLQHIGTGLPWDFRLGPGTDSERRHLDAMRAALPPKSMLTADAGFISFNLCRWLIGQGHYFLLRVGSNTRLLTDLGWTVEVRGKTVFLWPRKQRHLPPVVLRLIVVTQDDHQPVFLVTNVLDEDVLSDADAAELYRLRWGIELYYRSFKQTLGHKTLQSRTPQMALAEQAWHVWASWLLQMITARELMATGQSPASWSAAKARDAVRRLLRKALINQLCPVSQAFRRTLRYATINDSPRTGPKQIRKWPRKKQEKPPGPPKLQPAGHKERQPVQRLRETMSSKL